MIICIQVFCHINLLPWSKSIQVFVNLDDPELMKVKAVVCKSAHTLIHTITVGYEESLFPARASWKRHEDLVLAHV